MNKLILLSLSALCSVTAVGQSKINPAGRLIIDSFLEIQKSEGDLHPLTVTQAPIYSAVLILKEGYSAEDVLKSIENVEILSDMEGVAVVSAPLTTMDAIAALPEVIQLGFGDEMQPNLDFARPASYASNVQTGFTYDGQTVKLDGTGVICGMMDIGLEANHLNFKNTDGTTRIQRLWHMNSSNGSYQTYTPANIAGFTTDSQTQFHGTHVAGIMGGSYNGPGNFLQLYSADGSSGNKFTDTAIPFYGIATGSDLALACGQLYTPNIIQGVTNVIEYAESTGQPCVVNLSLGSNVGPHDGTDYYSQALSRLGQRGIIVIAAGNEGEDAISITKTLTSTGNNRYLRTYPNTQTLSSAIVDMWSNDATTIPAGWYYRKGTTDVPLVVAEPGKTVSSSSSTEFAALFNGTITIQAGVNPNNNRYEVYSSISNLSPKSTNTSYKIFFQAGGDNLSGKKLLVIGNGLTFSNRSSEGGATQTGFTAGSTANTINDAACAKNVISVGSYTTRTTWPAYPSSVYSYNAGSGYAVGEISPFSSYGEAFDGTKLPLVAAPGACVVSSYSRYYVEAQGITSRMAANAQNGTATDYWGGTQGTSMACPYVSGVVGLWLQACPTLTFDQIMQVINNTSTSTLAMKNSGRWGAGKINAMEGVKYIMQNFASVGSITGDTGTSVLITPCADGYTVTAAGESSLSLTLTDLQGRSVRTSHSDTSDAFLSTSGLQSGIYVLQVSGANTHSSHKITVK